MSIYIYRNGQQLGPFDEATARQKLASGEFSPDDQGIRHGESEWQPLGQMFGRQAEPQVVHPVATASAPAQAANLVTAGPTATKSGGFRRVLGWLMLIGGILGFIGGIGGVILTFASPASSGYGCQLADEAQLKLEDALKKLEAAKGTPSEKKLKEEFDSALLRAKSSSEACGSLIANDRLIRLVSIAIAVVSLIGAVIGFFLRR